MTALALVRTSFLFLSVRKSSPPHTLLPRMSLQLPLVPAFVNLVTQPMGCPGCENTRKRIVYCLPFISRVGSFGKPGTNFVLSPSRAPGEVTVTSHRSAKGGFDGTDLFLFQPSLFPRTPSVAERGNWGSAVTCQVGPEPPAIPLRGCEGCLPP